MFFDYPPFCIDLLLVCFGFSAPLPSHGRLHKASQLPLSNLNMDNHRRSSQSRSTQNVSSFYHSIIPSVLSHCWLSDKTGIRSVKSPKVLFR